MRVLLRLWAMCLRLILTSPFYWIPLAVALWAWWRHALSEWVWAGASAAAAAIALSLAMFLECAGGLLERVRLAQAGRLVLAAGSAALLTLSLLMWAAGMMVLR
jgi:hypothetical protein